MRTTKLVASIALVLIAGCKNTAANLAGEEYKQTLDQVKAVMEDFAERYPALEETIDGHRASDRAKVVAVIESDMLPLVDRGITSLDRAVKSGRNYVAKLDDTVAAKKTIAEQLDRMEGQLDGFRKVRATYEKEAALFRKPEHDDEAFQIILEARMAAARYIAGQPD